jgi:hypothetical protein
MLVAMNRTETLQHSSAEIALAVVGFAILMLSMCLAA